MGTSNGRAKLAELTSGVGALVLGLGLGALLAPAVGRAWLPVLVVGAMLHGWGMWDRHRVEGFGDAQPVWAAILYWICWLSLVGLGFFVLLR